MTHPSAPVTPGAGSSFHVDRERAPEAIRELEAALAELKDIRREAQALGRVDAGSRDSVSVDAARAFGLVAAGGPGSLVSALDAGIDQLRDLIDAMHRDLDAYPATDARTSARFGQADRG